MNDDYQRQAVEVEIYTLGPPLYTQDNEVVDHPVSRIKDTTDRRGGLPVMLDAARIGTAQVMTVTAHDGHEALCYRCDVELHEAEIAALRSPDGRVWADRIAAAMWTSGIYPTAIHLCSKRRVQ